MKFKKILLIFLLIFSTTMEINGKELNEMEIHGNVSDSVLIELYEMNEMSEEKDNIIYENYKLEDDYLIVQSTAEYEDYYSINLTAVNYDCISGTYSGGIYKIQIAVYVKNAVDTSVTFRNPVYYTQQVTYFDSGLGTPGTLTTTAKFTGCWGPIGDPRNYGQRTCASLQTTFTNIGTRYTGITEYFPVSFTNAAIFSTVLNWNVKGGTTKQYSFDFYLW